MPWDTVSRAGNMSVGGHAWNSERRKGKRPAMLSRAGYPSVPAVVDEDLMIDKVTREIEPKAMAMRAAYTK